MPLLPKPAGNATSLSTIAVVAEIGDLPNGGRSVLGRLDRL